LESRRQTPGKYRTAWDGSAENSRPMPSGMYFYKILALDPKSMQLFYEKTRSMVLVK
jgi:hypothetical protein